MFESYYGCMDSARKQKQKLPVVPVFVMNRDWKQASTG